jgi:hypothetical protein
MAKFTQPCRIAVVLRESHANQHGIRPSNITVSGASSGIARLSDFIETKIYSEKYSSAHRAERLCRA